MQLVKGLLDYAIARNLAPVKTMVMFTGNSFIKRNGALVMGRGAAQQVRDQYPGIDADFGVQINHLGFYGLLKSRQVQPNIGVFQVKYSAFEDANLELIRHSTELLRLYAEEECIPIYMNFPGIGNGGLTVSEVWPIICNLPDNVFIYW